MIDLSTIRSLELIKNLKNHRSTDCLFGLMNETLTPMGSRLLRSYILQPSTQVDVIGQRYDALQEISSNEEMFLQIRQGLRIVAQLVDLLTLRVALRSFMDVEKLLTDVFSPDRTFFITANNVLQMIVIPLNPDMRFAEQSINQILKLKSYAQSVKPIYDALAGVNSELLLTIRDNCRPSHISPTIELIDEVINGDVTFQQTPLDLRNQRTYAVKVCTIFYVHISNR